MTETESEINERIRRKIKERERRKKRPKKKDKKEKFFKKESKDSKDEENMIPPFLFILTFLLFLKKL